MHEIHKYINIHQDFRIRNIFSEDDLDTDMKSVLHYHNIIMLMKHTSDLLHVDGSAGRFAHLCFFSLGFKSAETGRNTRTYCYFLTAVL